MITQRKIMDKQELLNSKIGMKLVRIGKMTRAIANQRLKQGNSPVTPEQFTVLTAILDHESLYQRQIGALTLKDRPNITRIVNILEKQELIEKTPDVNKRKIYKITITQKGKEAYEEALPGVLDVWQDAIEGIDDIEIATCIKVLEKIKHNLESKLHIQI